MSQALCGGPGSSFAVTTHGPTGSQKPENGVTRSLGRQAMATLSPIWLLAVDSFPWTLHLLLLTSSPRAQLKPSKLSGDTGCFFPQERHIHEDPQTSLLFQGLWVSLVMLKLRVWSNEVWWALT